MENHEIQEKVKDVDRVRVKETTKRNPRVFQKLEMGEEQGEKESRNDGHHDCSSGKGKAVVSSQPATSGSAEGASLIVNNARKNERPPADDCCPICFSDFDLPCKTNCGHWFCAKCILQLWHYRRALQQCDCPICCCSIDKLSPEASLLSRREADVVQMLKNIQQYNQLNMGGWQGLFLKIIGSLLFVTKRILRWFMDPHHFRINYYLFRSFAIMLAGLYEMYMFDFIPTGGLEIRQLFELCAVTLLIMLCLVGLYRKLMQRRHVMHLAAMQPQHL